MKRQKFVTVDIEGEDNIAVIEVGDLTDVHKDDIQAYFTKNVEKTLVRALEFHFDCPAKVTVPALEIKTYHPLTVEYVVLLETPDEDKRVTVTLNEIEVFLR